MGRPGWSRTTRQHLGGQPERQLDADLDGAVRAEHRHLAGAGAGRADQRPPVPRTAWPPGKRPARSSSGVTGRSRRAGHRARSSSSGSRQRQPARAPPRPRHARCPGASAAPPSAVEPAAPAQACSGLQRRQRRAAAAPRAAASAASRKAASESSHQPVGLAQQRAVLAAVGPPDHGAVGGVELLHPRVGLDDVGPGDPEPPLLAHHQASQQRATIPMPPKQPQAPPIRPITGTPAARAASTARIISETATRPALASWSRTPPDVEEQQDARRGAPRAPAAAAR